ncbi:carbohydrate porin [Komagataeibacter medellinensis]|uniref:Carbohydrate porin n=2 Tax=Komagataeibacter medellinensis TaxID=1177712 RepID=A0ABQ6VWK8_9PROT|nr:carbohydrate porin [Komagataeibacter medellinensis]
MGHILFQFKNAPATMPPFHRVSARPYPSISRPAPLRGVFPSASRLRRLWGAAALACAVASPAAHAAQDRPQSWPGTPSAIPAPGSAPMVASTTPVRRKRPIVETRLDALFNTESISALLNHNDDALRQSDLSAGYFVAEQAFGNLVPQIRPWRDWLSNRGFSFELTYKGEGMANVGGGVSKGMDYVHDLRVSMLFDLGRLVGLDGWYLHGIIMNREGRQVGWDHVGERNVLLTEVWSIHGPAAARLADLYVEKSFLHNRININMGRIALTHTYATSVLLCTFMTQCSAPMAIREPAGWSVYPKTSWGGTVRFRPTRDLTLRTGIYKIGPKVQDNTGWAWGSESTTGIQTPVELTWEPFFGVRKLPGHYKLGYGHDTSPYPDLIGPVPAAYAAAIRAHREKPRDTFYVEADQMVYRRHGDYQMAGGYVLAGYIHNTPSISNFADEFYFGASLLGLIPHRPFDRFGVMYSYYQMSPRLTYGQSLRQAAGLPLGPYITGPQTHSAILEAYYGIPVTPGLVMTPEFEYVMRPGETSVIPNAMLVGLKVIANL